MGTRLWFGCVVLAVGVAAAVAQEPSKAEVAKSGKAACVLVDAKPKYGSAFGVAEGGYFITNQHVVATAGVGGTVKLILRAGEKDQVVADAKVVRADEKLDLALLKADLKVAPAPLPLGDDGKLGELDELVGFGFPFGRR